MLDIKAAAAYLGITEYSLRQLTKRNAIPHLVIGGKYKYIPEALKDWIFVNMRGKANKA